MERQTHLWNAHRLFEEGLFGNLDQPDPMGGWRSPFYPLE